MTMFIDNQIDRLFRRMSEGLLDDGLLRELGGRAGAGPLYYGYTMTVGPDGRPVVREYGNAGPAGLAEPGAREPAVDAIADEKAGTVKLIAEMPGVEKADLKVTVDDGVVDISAERGEKKYRARVPLRREVDEASARASYKNGILELVFALAEEKPTGRRVEVE